MDTEATDRRNLRNFLRGKETSSASTDRETSFKGLGFPGNQRGSERYKDDVTVLGVPFGQRLKVYLPRLEVDVHR